MCMKTVDTTPYIIVLSPHLDDAVLDVANHIQMWKSQGYAIKIVTLFTTFRTSTLSRDVRRYTGISFSSPREFETKRRNEDKAAMRLLGVQWQHLSYTDGGFRTYKNKLIYPKFKQLFSGKISSSDMALLRKIENSLAQYLRCDRILIPLGIGGHIDHVLVRLAAEAVFPKEKVGYYADYPYALSLFNWTVRNIILLLSLRRSVIPFQKNKEELLACYTTQIPFIYPNNRHYKEIVLEP